MEDVSVMDVQNVMERMQQRNREMFKVRACGVTASCVCVQCLCHSLSLTHRCAVLCCCHVQVPPYILYVARAFSTLEGIGLSANDDYSIVSEAYPYLSKRLLTDDSPRAKAALRSMVYGGSDKDAANSSPDFAKFLSMGEGIHFVLVRHVRGTRGRQDGSNNSGTKGRRSSRLLHYLLHDHHDDRDGRRREC